MKITTKEEYDKIPNDSILNVFLVGDKWEDNIGESETVIKKEDKLYVIPIDGGYFCFSEMNEPGYEFIIAYQKNCYKGDE